MPMRSIDVGTGAIDVGMGGGVVVPMRYHSEAPHSGCSGELLRESIHES